MKVNEKNENWEDLFRVKDNGEPVMPGKVLVAEPFLQDKYFGRSVVYLANHDSAGSVGFVLNKRCNGANTDAAGTNENDYVFFLKTVRYMFFQRFCKWCRGYIYKLLYSRRIC